MYLLETIFSCNIFVYTSYIDPARRGEYTCNPSTQEAVAGGRLSWFTRQHPNQPGLYRRKPGEDGPGASLLSTDAWQ